MVNFFRKLPSRWKIAFAACAAFLTACGEWQYLYAFDRPAAEGSAVVDIPQDMTGAEIGGLLEEKGIIASARVFRAGLFLEGRAGELKSGRYRLPLGMTAEEAAEELCRGAEEAFQTVTIPEGSTAAQIEAIMKKAGLSGAEGFLAEASDYAPLPYMAGPEKAKVAGEGFLFADTYDIPESWTARQICDLMYRRTDEVLDGDVRKRAEAKGMTLHDLMTIASLVEREARFPEDQEPIASVILARLAKGMPLQIDAAVQYALPEQKPELTLKDLEVDSPYNTYKRTGLPPGPIGSPGKAAILAVLAAEPGDYLYYVAKADGHHVFLKTYDEHLRAIGEIYGNS